MELLEQTVGLRPALLMHAEARTRESLAIVRSAWEIARGLWCTSRAWRTLITIWLREGVDAPVDGKNGPTLREVIEKAVTRENLRAMHNKPRPIDRDMEVDKPSCPSRILVRMPDVFRRGYLVRRLPYGLAMAHALCAREPEPSHVSDDLPWRLKLHACLDPEYRKVLGPECSVARPLLDKVDEQPLMARSLLPTSAASIFFSEAGQPLPRQVALDQPSMLVPAASRFAKVLSAIQARGLKGRPTSRTSYLPRLPLALVALYCAEGHALEVLHDLIEIQCRQLHGGTTFARRSEVLEGTTRLCLTALLMPETAPVARLLDSRQRPASIEKLFEAVAEVIKPPRYTRTEQVRLNFIDRIVAWSPLPHEVGDEPAHEAEEKEDEKVTANAFIHEVRVVAARRDSDPLVDVTIFDLARRMPPLPVIDLAALEDDA